MDDKNKNDDKVKQGEEPKLKRVLSLGSLVFYGLAFMVPLTIFTTYGGVTTLTHGMVPLTYVVTTICMAFTAYSYVSMTKVFPSAGSVYTFVQKSMNPYLGFMSGWAILIGYLFLPMLNYLATGLFLNAAIPSIPPWVWIILMALVVTVVNYFGIKLADIFDRTIVWIQLIFLMALLIMIIRYVSMGNGEGTLLSFESFINIETLSESGMGLPILLSGASLLALGFLGFDAISTLSEEAINPKRDIGRAIMIACVGAGIMFTIISYFLQVSWPTAWLELYDPDTGSYEIIGKVAGSVMASIFTAAYALGCLASSISGVTSASRVLYGMGRDGILPKRFFAHLHPKYKTPTYSVLLIGILSLSALVIPFTVAISLLNFGALLGFGMVNLSVIAHYFIRSKQRSGLSIIRYLILPLCGAVFTFTLWIYLAGASIIMGFIWLAIGLAYLMYTTKFFKQLPPEMEL